MPCMCGGFDCPSCGTLLGNPDAGAAALDADLAWIAEEEEIIFRALDTGEDTRMFSPRIVAKWRGVRQCESSILS